MAISHFTDFIGKQVSFIYEDKIFTTRDKTETYIKKVQGTISGVCIYNHDDDSNFLDETEFLIRENDEFYSFKEVTFFESLPNPVNTYKTVTRQKKSE